MGSADIDMEGFGSGEEEGVDTEENGEDGDEGGHLTKENPSSADYMKHFKNLQSGKPDKDVYVSGPDPTDLLIQISFQDTLLSLLQQLVIDQKSMAKSLNASKKQELGTSQAPAPHPTSRATPAPKWHQDNSYVCTDATRHRTKWRVALAVCSSPFG